MALIGALITTVIGFTCLLTTTSLHATDSQTAVPMGENGDRCNVTDNATKGGRCNPDLFLNCDTSTSRCRCMAGMFVDVNSDAGRCSTKVGERCTNYTEEGLPNKYCTTNAECLPDPSGALRCYCKRDFVPNSFGACSHSYSVPCSRNKECSPSSFLKCGLGQTCVCDFENDSQVWNATLRQCTSLIRADCTPKSGVERPCIDSTKSFCQKNLYGGICKCNSGLIPSSNNHRCAKPYNGSCNTTADCGDHLVCNMEKKCGCQNPENRFYAIGLRQCIAYAGTNCIDLDGRRVGCVKHAKCIFPLPEGGGVCICNRNFHYSENRFCKPNSGMRMHSRRIILFLVAVLIVVEFILT